MKPTLVVLAAGMGSRFGGVKQMEGLGPDNQWLLEYSVYDAITSGFGKIVFVLRDEIVKDFMDYFEERLPKHIERDYVVQNLSDVPDFFTVPKDRKKPWGTGQAVLTTREVVHEPFAVINADDFYGRKAFQQLHSFLSNQDNDSFHYGMVGYLLKNTLSKHGTVSRGVCQINNHNKLVMVQERTMIERQQDGQIVDIGSGTKINLEDDTIVSMNCWALNPSFFQYLETCFEKFLRERGKEEKSEFYLPFPIQEMISKGLADVDVMVSKDDWFGVTYRADAKDVKLNLLIMTKEGIYPKDLWA